MRAASAYDQLPITAIAVVVAHDRLRLPAAPRTPIDTELGAGYVIDV